MSAQPLGTDATVDVPRRGGSDGRTSSRRLLRTAGLALTAVLATAGCAAGQIAQTAEQKSSIDGTNRTLGTMALRGVVIAAPPNLATSYKKGSAAILDIVLASSSNSNDTLTSISSPAAGGWAYFADYNDAYAVQQAAGGASASSSPSDSESAPSSESAEPSGTESGSESGSQSESPSNGGSQSDSQSESESPSNERSDSESQSESPSETESSSAAPLPSGAQSVTIPAQGRLSSGTPDAKGAILLTGLTKQLFPGSTINLTFTFAKAGTITVPVPVAVTSLPREEAPGTSDEGGE